MNHISHLLEALADGEVRAWLTVIFYFTGGYLACVGLGTLSDRWWPEPPAPVPKPRTYRVTVEDMDGRPLQSYDVPVEVSAAIIQTLERSPKPRAYRVTVEDKDGWPLRSYDVPVEVASPILRDLERPKHK